MASLDFTGVFEDEEKEEVAVKEQTVQPTATSFNLSGVFDDDEETVETDTVEEETAEEDGTFRFDGVFDDDEDIVTTEVEQPSREPTVEETPEQELIRTGVMPVGYKRVVSVPTGNRPEDRIKLVPIDAPTPTVSEQTESAFGFGETAKMADVLYGDDDADLIGLEDTDDKKGVTWH